MSRTTGRGIDDVKSLLQSIKDILTTPIGTRVMRRDYGSEIHRLLDLPLNSGNLLLIYAATADALAKWEPRFITETVAAVQGPNDGSIDITITGEYIPLGEKITIEGIVVGFDTSLPKGISWDSGHTWDSGEIWV